jgi:hypothetical protein
MNKEEEEQQQAAAAAAAKARLARQGLADMFIERERKRERESNIN